MKENLELLRIYYTKNEEKRKGKEERKEEGF